MYKTINGWTKAAMLKVVKARKFDGPAMNAEDTCVYLGDDGNKCGVGLFLPQRHKGRNFMGPLRDLVDAYPDLLERFPLPVGGMAELQGAHDKESFSTMQVFGGDAKAAMIAFIKKNVEA